MNTRIKTIRSQLKITQADFAGRLGVSQNSVARWELGDRIPSEAIIRSICREFNVSYEWLKDGVEPMMVPQEAVDLSNLDRIMSGDDEFAKATFRAFAKLDADQWKKLREFVEGIFANEKGGR